MRGDDSRTAGRSGFTLIELMIVVAIIGLLSAIAIPKFSDLIVKTQEGTTKGNLGRIRSALNIYYSDMEGYFPTGSSAFNTNSSTLLSTSLVPKYINVIPQAKLRWHVHQNKLYLHSQAAHHGTLHDATYGHWAYDGINPQTSGWGHIWVMCSHTDKNGVQWSSY